MSSMALEIALTLHQSRCTLCRARKPCPEGWRKFNDQAQMIARQRDPKRAKA